MDIGRTVSGEEIYAVEPLDSRLEREADEREERAWCIESATLAGDRAARTTLRELTGDTCESAYDSWLDSMSVYACERVHVVAMRDAFITAYEQVIPS